MQPTVRAVFNGVTGQVTIRPKQVCYYDNPLHMFSRSRVLLSSLRPVERSNLDWDVPVDVNFAPCKIYVVVCFLGSSGQVLPTAVCLDCKGKLTVS